MRIVEKKAHSITIGKLWALRQLAAEHPHFRVAGGAVVACCARIVSRIGTRIGTCTSEGVFVGQYQPKDRDGKSLGKTFNVYAAPSDLTDEFGKATWLSYDNAVKRIAELKGWNGFDGTHYPTDQELYQALKEGSYHGGWIIPPRELLSGMDVDNNYTQPDNLCVHKDKGALQNTFCTVACCGSYSPRWYLSSTDIPDKRSRVYTVLLSDGTESADHKDGSRLSCRPVRLVPA